MDRAYEAYNNCGLRNITLHSREFLFLYTFMCVCGVWYRVLVWRRGSVTQSVLSITCIPGIKYRLFDFMASAFTPWAISKARTTHFNLLLLGETFEMVYLSKQFKVLRKDYNCIRLFDTYDCLFKKIFKIFLCILCVHTLSNMSSCTQGGQRHWAPWSWNDRWLWIEFEFFGRTFALKWWATSSAIEMLSTVCLYPVLLSCGRFLI